MRQEWVIRGLGLLLIIGTVPVLLRVNEPLGGMLAFALGVTGVFVAVVVPQRVVPAEGAEALLQGGAVTLAEVTAGLKLQGRPVYVHDQGNVGGERLFLPASDNPRPVPILDARTVTYSGGGDTKLGLALTPPGSALVKRHEADAGIELAGASIPEVEAFLRGLTRTHDLARHLRVTEEAGGFQIRFAASAVKPPCIENPVDPTCERTGCALCQASACALVRAMGQPLTLTEVKVDPPWVRLHLRPQEDA